jgi:energy-coupling factor transporter ATP-binding protein EcfA2
MDSNSFKNEPMQLLNVNENGIIDITTEATDYLNSFKKEKLCILSIIGPRNSGKSKLLNSFLKIDNNGFNINETKGLWIWGKPLELENNKKLLILDCQALENDDVSLRLFLICELLSTYIIYNTKGEINDNLINDFFKFLDVSKTINIYSQGNKKNTITNLSNYLPDLLWIMNEYENK